MVSRRLAALLTAAALCFLSASCNAQQISPDSSLTVLTIGTADTGGTMYPVGSAIASVLSSDTLKINVGASSGSAMNIQNLISSEVDLALVSGDTAYAAYTDPAGAGENLRAVAAVFISQSTWIAPVSGGVFYVHDLKGMRLGVGPQSSSTELSAQAAIQALDLEQSGTVIQNCGLGSGSELVFNGELDALHGFSGSPINALSDLAQNIPCRVLRYTQDELDQILASNDFYIPTTLAAGTYSGQYADIDTFGVPCLLCVSSSMDEELVYQLTQTLWQSRDELIQAHHSMSVMAQDSFLYEDLLIPLHSGAQRFYQEIEP